MIEIKVAQPQMTMREIDRRRALLKPYREAEEYARHALENHERCGCGEVEMMSAEGLDEIQRDVSRQEAFILEALEQWWRQDCRETSKSAR